MLQVDYTNVVMHTYFHMGITLSAAIVALSPILAFITCLVLLLHMVGSVR